MSVGTAMETQQSEPDGLLDAVRSAVGVENLGKRLINVRWSTISRSVVQRSTLS